MRYLRHLPVRHGSGGVNLRPYRLLTAALVGCRLWACLALFTCGIFAQPQVAASPQDQAVLSTQQAASAHVMAAQRRATAFLHGRSVAAAPRRATAAARADVDRPATPAEDGPSAAWSRAKAQHLGMLAAQRLHPQAASLTSPWTAVGPLQVQTDTYGLVTGRVTAAAIDPGDASGNTVCTVTSQYGDLSAVQTVSVTLLTGTTARRVLIGGLVWLLPVLGLAPLCRRRRVARGLLLMLMGMVSLAAMNGCGSDRKIAESGTGTGGGGTTTPVVTTPGGTYNIVVSATAAGVTHSVPLTLIVK